MGPRGPRGTRAAQIPAWGVSGEVQLGARFSAANAAALWARTGGRAGGGSRANPGLRAGGWSPRVQVRDLAARWRQAGSESDCRCLWRPGFSGSRGSVSPSLCLWQTSCCPLLGAWVPALGTARRQGLGPGTGVLPHWYGEGRTGVTTHHRTVWLRACHSPSRGLLALSSCLQRTLFRSLEAGISPVLQTELGPAQGCGIGVGDAGPCAGRAGDWLSAGGD